MHKNYNSCLHILDMHVERGRHQFSHRKQILVLMIFGDLNELISFKVMISDETDF